MNENPTNRNMVRLTEPTNGRTTDRPTDRLHTLEILTHSSSNAGITDAMLIFWQPILISFLLPILYIYVCRMYIVSLLESTNRFGVILPFVLRWFVHGFTLEISIHLLFIHEQHFVFFLHSFYLSLLELCLRSRIKERNKLLYLHDLPFDFIFDFGTLNNIVVIALLENRFDGIETHEFNFGGTFSGCTFCCDGRCGARASRYSNWWCLKCGRCRRNDCCGRAYGWHSWRCCYRHLTNHHSSWAAVRTRFVLLLFITHTEI